MDRNQRIDAAYRGAEPVPAGNTAAGSGRGGLTAGLAALNGFIWTAVLLLPAGWLADLIWGGLPGSLLAYLAVAATASAAVGYLGHRLLSHARLPPL